MIDIKNLCFSYGEKELFVNFSAEFATGTATAVMGVSGKGKTTLLNLIAGLLKPKSGEIRTDGGISYTFQGPRLIPSLTVLDNLRIVLRFSEDSERIALETLKKLRLDDAADKYPSELSGGMAKRAALARSLIFPCDILLIDEPFGELDAESKKNTAAAITQTAVGKTLLAVVHDEDDAKLLNAEIFRI